MVSEIKPAHIHVHAHSHIHTTHIRHAHTGHLACNRTIIDINAATDVPRMVTPGSSAIVTAIASVAPPVSVSAATAGTGAE